MYSVGIDIGSSTVKVVGIKDNEITMSKYSPNSHNPIEIAKSLLADQSYDVITVTGYGRHLFEKYYQCPVISEIKAAAVGIKSILPQSQAIIDVGGQDVKVITLDERSNLAKFEMNDKCAAGTGKFLEVMAVALGFEMSEFIQAALNCTTPKAINSMCTVFAESEIISMVHDGIPRDGIALGIHKSIANRIISMAKRVGIANNVAFIGGGALNDCLYQELKIQFPGITRPDLNPQTIVALGAAQYGLTNYLTMKE